MKVIIFRVLTALAITGVSMWVLHRKSEKCRSIWFKTVCCVFAFIAAAVSWKITDAVPFPVEQIKITALGEKNEQSKKNEIYITGIYANGEQIELKKVSENSWFWQGNWYVWRNENDTRRPTVLSDSFVLEIPIGTGRSVEFFANGAKGIVQTEYAGEVQTLDCFSEKDRYITAKIPDTSPPEVHIHRCIMLVLFAMLYAVLYLLLMLVFFRAAKKENISDLITTKIYQQWDKLFLIIFSLGTFLLLQNVFPSSEHFYFDHFVCLGMARAESLKDAIEYCTKLKNVEPPLTLLINYFYYKIAPFGKEWMFLVPAALISLSVYWIGSSVSKFTNKAMGIIAAMLTIGSVTMLEYGKDTRCYSIIIPITLCLVFSYTKLRLFGETAKNFFWYTISLILTAYCSYHAIVLLLGVFIFDIIWQRKRFSLKLLAPYLIAGLLYFPWLALVGINLIGRVSAWRETATWHLKLNTEFITELFYQLSGQNLFFVLVFLCSALVLAEKIIFRQALENKYFICTFSAYLICFFCAVRLGWALLHPDNTLLQYRYFSALIPLFILTECALPQYVLDCIFSSRKGKTLPYCLISVVLIAFIISSIYTVVDNQNRSNTWFNSPERIIKSKEVYYQTSCVYIGGASYRPEKKQALEYMMYQKNRREPVNCVAYPQNSPTNIHLLGRYEKIFSFDASDKEISLIQKLGFEIVNQYSNVVVLERKHAGTS